MDDIMLKDLERVSRGISTGQDVISIAFPVNTKDLNEVKGSKT